MDDEASKILDSTASAYGGDANQALAEVLRAYETIESFLDEFEANHRDELTAQKEQSERDFREGRFTSWEEVKRRNRL